MLEGVLCWRGTVRERVLCWRGYCAEGSTVLERILLEGDTMLVEDTVLEWVLCWRGYCAGGRSLAAMPCAATAVHHRDSGPELAMRLSPNTASFQRL